MKYYPNVLARASRKMSVCHFSTYDSCDSYNQALDVIENWRKQMLVLCSWVDDGSGKTIHFVNYTNAIGGVAREKVGDDGRVRTVVDYQD